MARSKPVDDDSDSSNSANISRKRKNQDTGDDSQSKKRSKQQFSYLKPQKRTVSESTVRAEWRPLAKPAQQQARDLFLTTKRSTLNHIADGPRRREAEFVVNDVLRRLEKQLPRMPFPTNTKAAQLDLDGILENVRILEAEKTPVNDSVKLLQEQIEREEQRIEQKRSELAKLEKEVKAASKARKLGAFKTHPLLADYEKKANVYDDMESIGLVVVPPQSRIFDDADEELTPLLAQLQNHLDSINANTQQVANVDEEMLRTRAALAAILPQQNT